MKKLGIMILKLLITQLKMIFSKSKEIKKRRGERE